ncbi:DUF4349 domain-containing protein [Sorangium atrum]|uniref:DUF4349 domain-containing protein n=1 Tax=Sorangium atrum TaxID=2995308 RepID=A0ABT5CBT2_9BACT|nr:DUF4349 domain-containing protein [Sorangium aterium]MDC0682582.1 DUF4349 domain-containing protein [Sorangium aterium]
MRRTLPVWALLASLAGPTACSSAPSAARDASSSPSYGAAPAPVAGMPPGVMQTTGASTRSGSVREESYDAEVSAAGDFAKAAPPPAPGGGAQPPAARPAPTAATPQPAPTSSGAAPQGAPQAAGEVSAARAPLLVYTADIAMAVFEVGASLGKVEALARDLGGFLARRDDRTITIRIPAARFDEALKRLEGLGDILQRNVVAEDVTEEFLDLGIRIRNARAVRDRLEKLLEKAAKVEESIQLERELARVSSELERLEGRLKFLRDRVAFSTLTVTFQPRSTETLAPSGPRLPIDWLNELGLSRLLNL